MLSTSARLLRLASLLQSRRHWPGSALADELGVDTRTVRRDVDRLRELGYPVQASSGVGGGYALGRGADLPPLVLDDEEAVALAIALRAAGATVGGIEATSLRLLGKLDQLLPTRLRRRATALHAVTLSLRGGMPPLVDAGMLSEIATACRDTRVLRFGYRSHAGDPSQRHVQPSRVANYGRRWYLIAWDIDRGDWRSFRVDRIDKVRVTGDTFLPRPVPADVATRLERGIAYEPFACRICLRLQGSVDELQAVLPVWCGVLEPETATHSLLHVGAESPEHLLAQVLMIGQDVELVEAEAMAPGLQRVLARMAVLFGAAVAVPD
ncbi:helix-turn-helix transcriptional regulator [Thermomonas carbonis]|uniref:YafY family transcriptional regulator n=1 Tax=Thermomonas carbonis TaxID=1463158 RepID=A0A7G9ST56_9GAMM|nr:YafY family protein [Thermomonas carbonis]QNN71031.1 YafY family transcriptional regulator [Thermomonas carbonis]GHC04057.1 transcriptional regulator [Thermomonas carbonis]